MGLDGKREKGRGVYRNQSINNGKRRRSNKVIKRTVCKWLTDPCSPNSLSWPQLLRPPSLQGNLPVIFFARLSLHGPSSSY